MSTFLTVWILGWAATAASMNPWLRVMAKDRTDRTQTAGIRTLWGSRQGRAGFIMLLFIVWPVILFCMGLLALLHEKGDEPLE